MALINTVFTVTHQDTQKVSVPTVLTNKVRKPPFSSIGRKGMSSTKDSGFDVHELFLNLSPTATWVFWYIDARRDYKNNLSFIISSSLTAAEKLKLNRAYKELEDKEVLIRIKRETYLINPKVMLPENYEATAEKWKDAQNKLKAKNLQNTGQSTTP